MNLSVEQRAELGATAKVLLSKKMLEDFASAHAEYSTLAQQGHISSNAPEQLRITFEEMSRAAQEVIDQNQSDSSLRNAERAFTYIAPTFKYFDQSADKLMDSGQISKCYEEPHKLLHQLHTKLEAFIDTVKTAREAKPEMAHAR